MNKLHLILLLPLLNGACGEPSETPRDSEINTSASDPATDPVALFEAVNEAVLSVDAVYYNFTVEGISVMDDTARFVSSGEALLQKGSGTEDACIYITYTVTTSPDNETEQGVVAANAEGAAHLNLTRGSYIFGLVQDGGAALVLANNIPRGAVLSEFLFTEQPFGAVLNAAGYQIQEPEEIYGTLCHVVTADIPPYRSTWWISTETMLPLCNFLSVWDSDGTGMEYLVTLTNLDTEIQPDQSVFVLPCPGGIEPRQISGFLPNGTAAPLWTLETPTGEVVSLDDLRGRVVVMDFWATWCMPCRQVMPVLQELHDNYGEELFVAGINTWEEAPDPAGFIAQMGLSYPILLGGDAVALQYLVQGIPTFYVIDQQGNIAFHAVGADPANEEGLRQAVAALLAE